MRPSCTLKHTQAAAAWLPGGGPALLGADGADARGATRQPYEVLGVETDAQMNAIRKAYRRLSLLLHPDKVILSCPVVFCII